MSQAPSLAGIHHVKLPVSDLQRSVDWYASRLGYTVAVDFTEGGTRVGVAMAHPNGGPMLGLRVDPERAAVAGFAYFSIGVPDRAALEDLEARLSAAGESHGGIREASMGWVLPQLHDPDGHELAFYAAVDASPIERSATRQPSSGTSG